MRKPPTLRKLTQLLIPAVAAAGLGLTMLAPNGTAAPAGAGAPKPAPRSAPAPQPASATVLAADLAPGHAADPARSATKTSIPAQRPPLPAAQNASERKQARSAAKAAADCNVSDFTSKTGAALVEQIKKSETTCINTLFSVTGEDSKALFREEQMVTVANALKDVATNYPGDNSTSATQVVLYLRAGYYVQYNQPENVGEYGPTLKSAIQGALDAFFGSSHAFDVTDANGETLAETVTLIDSSGENARYLDVVKRLQKDYNSSYDSSTGCSRRSTTPTPCSSAATRCRSSWKPSRPTRASSPDCVTSPSPTTICSAPTSPTWPPTPDANSAASCSTPTSSDTVKPLVKELLGRSEITGRTAPLWVGLAEMTDEYDKENCAEYDTCDLQNRVRDAVLTVKHTCGPSVEDPRTGADRGRTRGHLRQPPQAGRRTSTTSSRTTVRSRTTTTPASRSSPSTPAPTTRPTPVSIFGIDTNNGGMYLEGDPAAEGNQPRFIAYEAERARTAPSRSGTSTTSTPTTSTAASTCTATSQPGMTTPTVMWVEGFAEYVSYSYRGVTYDRAITEAGKNTYKLSTLFGTTYDNADTTRIYQWGYLAVRYMLQSHPADVATLLGHYRAGD